MLRGAFAHIRTSGFTSAGAHLGVIVLAQFGLPLVFTPPPVTATVIPVEVVRLDDVTRPPPAATPEPEPESTREATPQAPPRPPQPVPEPPKPPEIKPVAKAEPTPPPPPPVVIPKPEPAPPVANPEPPKPEPEPKPQIAKASPKAKPKPPEQKRDFDSILKDLSADKTPKKALERSREPETVNNKGADAPKQSQVSEVASIRELDLLANMIRENVRKCWSPPPGALDADTLQVVLRIILEKDGNVRSVVVENDLRMQVDNYFRAAAEAARRAVLKCQPLELPADKYEIWKRIRINFDPGKMLS